MSKVVLAELYAGAYNRPNPTKLLALIADALQEVPSGRLYRGKSPAAVGNAGPPGRPRR